MENLGKHSITPTNYNLGKHCIMPINNSSETNYTEQPKIHLGTNTIIVI